MILVTLLRSDERWNIHSHVECARSMFIKESAVVARSMAYCLWLSKPSRGEFIAALLSFGDQAVRYEESEAYDMKTLRGEGLLF